MDAFKSSLRSLGVTGEVVDENSKAPASSWKTYYRSAGGGKWGVLLAHVGEDMQESEALSRLNEEVVNYAILKEMGIDVPECDTSAFAVTDNMGEPLGAAALIVEHIDGRGPYKAFTEYRILMTYANTFAGPTLSAVKEAWRSLKANVAIRCPRDLQVMVTGDGRIVTIDPEAIGDGKTLSDWVEA